MSKTSKLKSSRLQPLLKLWNGDLTKAWTKLQAYGSATAVVVIEFIQSLSSVVNNDSFKSYLDVLHVPQYVPAILAVIGIIAYLTLPKGQDA
jgi:hypothetical protein